MFDEFDGRVLNPNGVEIDLPYWVFKRLKKLHLLERDRKTGKRRIQARISGLMALWDGPEFKPDRNFQALDPGHQKSRSKDSAYPNSFLKALGRDCSGLANPAIERTRTFESDLEHTRLSDEYQRAQVDELIAQIRAKRQVA
jgi:hypothetical protein